MIPPLAMTALGLLAAILGGLCVLGIVIAKWDSILFTVIFAFLFAGAVGLIAGLVSLLDSIEL